MNRADFCVLLKKTFQLGRINSLLDILVFFYAFLELVILEDCGVVVDSVVCGVHSLPEIRIGDVNVVFVARRLEVGRHVFLSEASLYPVSSVNQTVQHSPTNGRMFLHRCFAQKPPIFQNVAPLRP